MKKPKIREIIEAIKALIKGPYTTKFPYAPSIPPDGYRGKPEFSKEGCVGCGACAEVCPAAAIEVLDKKTGGKDGVRTLIHHQEICIYCGQCERACITQKGIKLTKEYELSTTDLSTLQTKIDRSLVVCEHCGASIACRDHLKWLSNKLGVLAFSNPTVLSAKLQDLELIEQQLPGDALHKRAPHNWIICPQCRREVLLVEQW